MINVELVIVNYKVIITLYEKLLRNETKYQT